MFATFTDWDSDANDDITTSTTAGGDFNCIALIWFVGSKVFIIGVTSTIPSSPNFGQGMPVFASTAINLLSLAAKKRL